MRALKTNAIFGVCKQESPPLVSRRWGRRSARPPASCSRQRALVSDPGPLYPESGHSPAKAFASAEGDVGALNNRDASARSRCAVLVGLLLGDVRVQGQFNPQPTHRLQDRPIQRISSILI